MVALFAVALLSVVALAGCVAEDSTRILSHYGSMTGVLGGPRGERHTGVDFDAPKGDPVIAAADGVVTRVHVGCLTLEHRIGGSVSWWTRYCHMDETDVWPGQQVKRGEVLGKVGTTGRSMGVPHLHFELCQGQLCQRVDPLPFIVGCFDAETDAYSALEASGGQPRLALTYPVGCASTKQRRPPR